MAPAHGPVTVPWHSVDSTKMAGSFGHLLWQLNVAVPPPPLPPSEPQAASAKAARDAAVQAPLERVGRVRPLIGPSLQRNGSRGSPPDRNEVSVLRVSRPTSRVEFDDVGEPCQPSRLELLRKLRDHVESRGIGGLAEGLGQLQLNEIHSALQRRLIAPPLPLARVNTPDLGPTRITDRPCFLDLPRIRLRQLGT